jgi:thiol-disulfide isomerase/thioredoxin
MSISWKFLVLCACLALGIVHRAGAETPPKQQRNSGEDKAAHASQSQAASPPRGRVVGTITVAGTNEPVAGATMRVILGKMDNGRLQSVTGETDRNGHYSIEVPIGNVRVGVPKLPPGYWTNTSFENATTSAAAPVFAKDYTVRRGPIWRVRAWDATHHVGVQGLTCGVTRVEGNQYSSTFSDTAAQGIAQVTLPGFRGEFKLAVADWNQPYKWETKPAHLTIDNGFRFEQPTEIKPTAKPDSFEIKDKNGKVATLRGASAALDRGQVLIDFDLVPLDVTAVGEVVGTIADEMAKPIAGARVTVVLGSKSGASSMTQLAATSGADGRFAIKNAFSRTRGEPGDQLGVVVVKDGYGGIDSPLRDPPADPKAPVDFGRLSVSAGKSIRVRVVADDGKPAVGAWIEPTGSYAVRNQLTTTDARGECVVHNLPQGMVRLSASYGDSYANSVAVVGDPNAQVTMKLKPIPKAASAPAKRIVVEPIKVGALAPALRVSGWTDGKTRSLDLYRGKIVVLDFWGTWCSACINALPAMKTLHAKYKDRDVVFLSIHSAGGDLEQIREFERQFKLESPSGLDVGDDVVDGVTSKSYGVRGYPTFLVIGRDGRINWSTDQMTKEKGIKNLERAAKALSIPWPIDEKAPREKLVEQMCRFQVYLIGEAIDQALAKP